MTGTKSMAPNTASTPCATVRRAPPTTKVATAAMRPFTIPNENGCILSDAQIWIATNPFVKTIETSQGVPLPPLVQICDAGREGNAYREDENRAQQDESGRHLVNADLGGRAVMAQ